MQLDLSHTQHSILRRNPWVIEFLQAKGFTQSSPTAFTNGQAWLRFEDYKLTADPGDGRKSWISNLADAQADTLKLLLQTILSTPPFAAGTDVAQARADQARGQAALAQLAQSLRDRPENEFSQHLRCFLWSLFNQHHLVNLWELNTTLDADQAQAVGLVFTSLLQGQVQESDLKRALLEAGEMDRWHRPSIPDSTLQKLEVAEDTVRNLLRKIPPSQAHTELVSLLKGFQDAKAALLHWP